MFIFFISFVYDFHWSVDIYKFRWTLLELSNPHSFRKRLGRCDFHARICNLQMEKAIALNHISFPLIFVHLELNQLNTKTSISTLLGPFLMCIVAHNFHCVLKFYSTLKSEMCLMLSNEIYQNSVQLAQTYLSY